MARHERLTVTDLEVQNIIGAGTLPDMGGIKVFLDPTNGSDGNDGLAPNRAFKTLASAYARLTANKNDAIYYIPGASGCVLTAVFDWDKAYTHLIGLHPMRFNNRCKITTATANTMTPLFTLTGNACIVKNMMFSQEGSHATGNAVPLYVVGDRCYLENVSTRNIGALAVVNAAHRSLKIGAADDLTFINCQFGECSYDAVTAASTVIEFVGIGGKWLFENCMIIGASSSSATFCKWGASAGGFTLFDRCKFFNRVGAGLEAMTQAFSIDASSDKVYLVDCIVDGATALETADSGLLYGVNAKATTTSERSVALTG